ncbi:MAG: hypothetical protein ACI3Y5_06705, partial [Prevotella sp.]
MKRIIPLILTLLLAVSTSAAAAGKSLVITFDNGTTQTYLLSTNPEVTVADNMLVVTAAGTTAQYTLADVLTFTFAETTGIKAAETAPGIMRHGDCILISTPTKVEAYTADGKAVSVQYTVSGGTTAVSLNSLPEGITILRAAGKTIKICR